MSGSRITMGPSGLDVDPVREPQPWPDLDPDGDYAWAADLRTDRLSCSARIALLAVPIRCRACS
jgi:hypothetical protein